MSKISRFLHVFMFQLILAEKMRFQKSWVLDPGPQKCKVQNLFDAFGFINRVQDKQVHREALLLKNCECFIQFEKY